MPPAYASLAVEEIAQVKPPLRTPTDTSGGPLLRQRRARREFGQDPHEAAVRDAGTVENYRG